MSREAPRLCVVGSANIDMTFRPTRLPQPGETLTGRAFLLGFGGKGANQAVMAARLGAHVTLVSKLGRDGFASQTRHHYFNENIDTQYVTEDAQHPSGVAA